MSRKQTRHYRRLCAVGQIGFHSSNVDVARCVRSENSQMNATDNLVFHVSDTPAIGRFEPRAREIGDPVVWAIDDTHLPNYWLPRDCPRVCVRRGGCGDHALIESILGRAAHAIYVETVWRDRIRNSELFCYAFDRSDFICVDATAGYYQSSKAVTPIKVTSLSDVEAMMAKRAVSLRYVDSLWSIEEVVTKSTLEFSAIRMRNALPR
jgi:hypothetical protein